MDQKSLLTRQTSIDTIDTGGCMSPVLVTMHPANVSSGGEDEKLAKRHRKFDLGALLAAARQVTGNNSKCKTT